MIESKGGSRRLFLRSLATLLGSGLLWGWTRPFSYVPGSQRAERADADLLLNVFRGSAQRASAQVVGREYLLSVPHEARADVLVALLRARLEIPERASIVSYREGLRGRIRRALAADFDAGEVQRLRGWVLSRTEARLCALAAVA